MNTDKLALFFSKYKMKTLKFKIKYLIIHSTACINWCHHKIMENIVMKIKI